MSDEKDPVPEGQSPEAPSNDKLLEGARGGVVLPIQTAPLDITNQVGGLPPADSGSAGGGAGDGSAASGSGEE
jgi:hypothetical protein